MKHSHQIRCAAILALGMVVIAQPQASAKGKPGGGGSEPPAAFAPVIAYRNNGIYLTDAQGANTTLLYSGNIFTVDFSPTRPLGPKSGQVAFSATNELTGVHGLRIIDYTYDDAGLLTSELSEPLDTSEAIITDIDYSPDGTAILYKWGAPYGSSEPDEVRVFTAEGIQMIMEDPYVNVYDVAWLPGGRIAMGFTQNSIGPLFPDYIAVYEFDGTELSELPVKTLEVAEQDFALGHYHRLQAAHTSESLLITAAYSIVGKRGQIGIEPRQVAWDVDTGEIRQLGLIGWAGSFSPDDSQVVYQATDERLKVTEIATGLTYTLTTRSAGNNADWQPADPMESN